MSRNLRLIAFAALVSGLLIRIVPLLLYPAAPMRTCDGRAYFVIGTAWANGRGLYVDDQFLLEHCPTLVQRGPSAHFAPALALIEGTFVRIFGDTTLALIAPILLLSCLAVATVWWATRDLYGRDAGLLAAAAVSLEWTGAYFGTWLGYSENLVLIAVALTVWAVLRGLRNDRYMLAAGLFAGLGYLSKASIGWFFLVAGVGGLAWRLWFRGWFPVLANRWYWGAIAIFALPVFLWSARNIALFWDGTPLGLLDAWQTSTVNARLVANAINQPPDLFIGLAGKFPVLLVGLAAPFAPLLPRFAGASRRWREEEAVGLWMTVVLIFGLGWFFAAVFWIGEGYSLFWADAIRYVMPAQVPLLWLVLRHGEPFPTRPWSVSLLILGAMTVVMPILYMHGPLRQ